MATGLTCGELEQRIQRMADRALEQDDNENFDFEE